MSLDLLLLTFGSIVGSASVVYVLVSKKLGTQTQVSSKSKEDYEKIQSAKAEAQKIILDAKTDALKVKKKPQKKNKKH